MATPDLDKRFALLTETLADLALAVEELALACMRSLSPKGQDLLPTVGKRCQRVRYRLHPQRLINGVTQQEEGNHVDD